MKKGVCASLIHADHPVSVQDASPEQEFIGLRLSDFVATLIRGKEKCYHVMETALDGIRLQNEDGTGQ